jgi:hypothetical protein
MATGFMLAISRSAVSVGVVEELKRRCVWARLVLRKSIRRTMDLNTGSRGAILAALLDVSSDVGWTVWTDM